MKVDIPIIMSYSYLIPDDLVDAFNRDGAFEIVWADKIREEIEADLARRIGTPANIDLSVDTDLIVEAIYGARADRRSRNSQT